MHVLSIPLLDMITVPKKEDQNRVPETSEKELEQRSDSVQSSESVQEENTSDTTKRDENSFPFLLLISGIINVVLLILLFRRNTLLTKSYYITEDTIRFLREQLFLYN